LRCVDRDAIAAKTLFKKKSTNSLNLISTNMLISKFDLYRSGWLELVFDDRNKAYGAYELRQHYAANMVKAMSITFFGVALLFGASIIFKPAPHEKMIVVDNHPIAPVLPPVAPPVKRIKPPDAKPIKQALPVNPPAMQRFVPPVVVPDPVKTEKPVINDKIPGAIGPETTKGPATPGNVLDKPDVPGTQPVDDKKLYNTGDVGTMPEPVGGDKAWAKFLNKNLRFPYAAQQEGISGRVILSFIVEKDGSLSNITVEQGAGHGFDEEALRVLKLAKAWKPGMQNGQAVRVRYDIPINFQLADPY
jgi:protein TonB